MSTSIINRIKEDQLAARKARHVHAGKFLGLLLSDVANIGKNDGNRESTDAEAVKEIIKYINNNKATAELLRTGEGNEDALILLQEELTLLNFYLPDQMTTAEIQQELANQKTSVATEAFTLGNLMTHFRSNFAGRYDGKLLMPTIVQQYPELAPAQKKDKKHVEVRPLC